MKPYKMQNHLSVMRRRIFFGTIVVTFISACAVNPPAIAPGASTYAGQETRAIKALSDAEIAAYTEGKGQGFAKPAELNGYPGPMHVLELADKLALSAAQRSASESLLLRHKKEVRDLGRAYILSEAALEKLFSSRSASPQTLRETIDESARVHSRIRAAHLETHLQQTALLTDEQNAAYQRLRGYSSGIHHH